VTVATPHTARTNRERVPPGRLVELSGEGACARTTTAVAAVLDAQREGETVAWIQPRAGRLFPPDLADSGVDLEALVVVRIPPRAGPYGLCRAAELLLRSGAFGLVLLDMCEGTPPPHDNAWQGRLLGLARQHQSRLIVLTHKSMHSASLGPLVSLRIESMRTRVDAGTFAIEHRALKNKSGGPLGATEDVRRGPWGLR
jgi:recombination protein RecA